MARRRSIGLALLAVTMITMSACSSGDDGGGEEAIGQGEVP